MNVTQKQKRTFDYHSSVVNSIYAFFKLNEDYQPGKTFPEFVCAMDDLVIRINPGRDSTSNDIIARIVREMRGVVKFSEGLTDQQLTDNSIFITTDVVQTSDAMKTLLQSRGFTGTISNGFIIVEFEDDLNRAIGNL